MPPKKQDPAHQITTMFVVAANVLPTIGAPVPQLAVITWDQHVKNNRTAMRQLAQGKKPRGAWIAVGWANSNEEAIQIRRAMNSMLQAEQRALDLALEKHNV